MVGSTPKAETVVPGLDSGDPVFNSLPFFFVFVSGTLSDHGSVGRNDAVREY